MRILIDILHPAHVHFFKHFHNDMVARGHEFLITVRTKEMSVELLERFGLSYLRISEQRFGLVGLASEMIQRTARLARAVGDFRPDVMTGIMGPSIAVAGALRRVPSVVFYDTEFAARSNWFTYPLAHSVCTPDCYQGRVFGRHVAYPGYHELAYLHPARFTPDPTRLACFGLEQGEPFTVVRFVSWQASHDTGERGLTPLQKHRLVELLERYGQVLISSEGPLPEDLQDRALRGPFEHVHHLLAHARMLVGESATMASEAGVLGVPAVLIATTSRGYIDDQERRYRHVRHFSEDRFEAALETIRFFAGADPKRMGREARARLLAEKIDVTEWMTNYFERNFASSRQSASASKEGR